MQELHLPCLLLVLELLSVLPMTPQLLAGSQVAATVKQLCKLPYADVAGKARYVGNAYNVQLHVNMFGYTVYCFNPTAIDGHILG